MEEKIHWIRLKAEFEKFGNGKALVFFQDGLPVRIPEIEGKKEQIDLTKELEK